MSVREGISRELGEAAEGGKTVPYMEVFRILIRAIVRLERRVEALERRFPS